MINPKQATTTPAPTVSPRWPARARGRTRRTEIPAARGCGGRCGSTSTGLRAADQPTASQQLVGRIDHGLRLEWKSGLRSGWSVCELLSTLFGAAQDDASRAVRPVALRPRRTEERDHRHAQRRRQMHGPVSPPTKSAARRVSAINSPTEHFTGSAEPPLAWWTALASVFLTRTVVDDDGQSTLSQRGRHGTERFRRPALRAPARAGIQDRESLAAELRQGLLGPAFRGGIEREQRIDVVPTAVPQLPDAMDRACSTTCAPSGSTCRV